MPLKDSYTLDAFALTKSLNTFTPESHINYRLGEILMPLGRITMTIKSIIISPF